MFAEHGYEGASVQQIAAQAGVVASVVYDHFGAKRELYLELLRQHGQALLDRSVRPDPNASPADLLRHNVDAFYRFVEADPFLWRVVFRDPPADPEIAAAHREVHGAAGEAIAALIASVRPDAPLVDGVHRDHAAAMLAEGVKAVNNGLAAWWFEHRDVPREHVVAVAETLLWSGLRRVADS